VATKGKRKKFATKNISGRDQIWFAGLALAFGLTLLLGYLWVDSLMPVFAAFALAYAFSPAADWLVRRGMGRSLAVAGLILAISLAGAGVLAFLLPAVLREGKEFIANLPQDLSVAASRVAEFAARFGLDLPVGQDLFEQLKIRLETWAFGEGAPGMQLAKRLFAGLGGAAAWGLNLLIIPVFFFFFLRDLPAIKQSCLGLVPARLQGMAWAVTDEINRVFSGYVRGQLTVAVLLGVVFATALSIMQVRFGLVIGLLAGFLNIIPYVGQITGLILALAMVLVEGDGFGRLIAIPILFGALNFIEGTFITPQIVGDKVGLSAPQTMLALILGAEMAGFVGMIIAIPLAGSIKVLLLDLVDGYKKSKYFEDKRPPR
jgi:predicted PurR-regulated permease PerM